MLTTNAFAGIGALLGDPTRASMLVAMMDGRALTATELAVVAGVTPQTASSHLAQLVAAGLVAMERRGRHRYHRLANAAIAQMIEGMMTVAATTTMAERKPLRTGPKDLAMRQARTCYDHLAGRVAVAIADSMIARGEIEFGVDGGELTAPGASRLVDMGVEVTQARLVGRKRLFCRPCLDWSERRPHIAGALGTSLLLYFRSRNWVRAHEGSRAVTITPVGERTLAALFDLDPALWRHSAT